MGAGRLHDHAVGCRPMARQLERITVKPRSTLPAPVEPHLGYWYAAPYCHPILIGRADPSVSSTEARQGRRDVPRPRFP
jgi:hypothetical protein